MSKNRLDKQGIRRSFARAAEGYDDLAGLQRQVGISLLQRFPLLYTCAPVVDLGCGTGFLSRQLSVCIPDGWLLAIDIAMPMLQHAKRKAAGNGMVYCCGDAERLPLRDASVEQVYSNLALQWLLDADSAFTDIKRVLQPGGKLVFSTFGPETLSELKTAWASVDGSVHVNRFFAVEEIRELLLAAGFRAVVIESELYRSRYPSVQALMKELKGIGAHNVNLGRKRKPTTKSELRRMIENYPLQTPDGSVPATYQALYVRAEA